MRSVVVDFQKFGIAFESSGGFGRQALSLWAQLKHAANEIGLDNYVTSGLPHTWSALTFERMIPQKISWTCIFLLSQVFYKCKCVFLPPVHFLLHNFF